MTIHSNNEDVLDRIKKDFNFFYTEEAIGEKFKFKMLLMDPPFDKIPKVAANKQSFNSLTYDDGDIRYNDYYGEALSVYDYSRDECRVYSNNLDRLHEITYLAILSRTGKKLDSRGIHKIHACGVHYKDKSMVVMLPMKGGKTTLFSELIKDHEVEILSDDTPLVDLEGRVFCFPLRIGLEDDSGLSEKLKADSYTIDRKQYGKKTLIPLTSFENKIKEGRSKKIILINGVRAAHDECRIIPVSSFTMFKYLMTHMVVGVGLPMIIEYFLRPDLKDWILNFRIGFSRTWAAMRLAMRSKNYLVEMGTNPQKNALELKKLF